MATEARRPIGQLLTDIVAEVTALMQTELRLIKVEMNEKVGQLANGGVLIGVAAVCLIAGLGIAFMAVTEWLIVAGLPREWSLTIVALAALVIGGLIALRGISKIKSTEMMPERALHHMRQDIHTIKEHVS